MLQTHYGLPCASSQGTLLSDSWVLYDCNQTVPGTEFLNSGHHHRHHHHQKELMHAHRLFVSGMLTYLFICICIECFYLFFESVIQCILSIFSHLSLLLPGSPHKVFLNSNMALGFTGSFSDKYRMCSEHIPHSPYSLSYPPPSLS